MHRHLVALFRVAKLCFCLFLSDDRMGKFMKNGKVVLVLGGRYAGRKAIIVKVIRYAFEAFTLNFKN